jgi:RNA polymerase sigma-70 factor (ECF subfamily)
MGDWWNKVEWSDYSDEQIVERVLSGEKDLFEVIMRRYNQRLYRLARMVVKADDEAIDVMQQSYVNAYARLHQFSGAAKFSSWLTRIALHEALARSKSRVQTLASDAEQLVDARVDPEREVASGELLVFLERGIETLPVEQRAVFVLRCIEEMSTAETAECLNLSADQVSVRLYRARVSLRRFLQHEVGAVAIDAFRLRQPVCDAVVTRVFNAIQIEAQTRL